MGKSQGTVNRALDTGNARDTGISQSELDYNQGQREHATSRAGGAYDAAFGGYSGMQQGGLSDADLGRLRPDWLTNPQGYVDSMRGSGGGGGGPAFEAYKKNWAPYADIEQKYKDAMSGKTVDTGALREGFGTFRNMMDTGGFDPNQLASMGEGIGMLKGMGFTGGLDENAIDRMRGKGVFDEYSQTGGVSDRDKLLLRDRGNSANQAYFSNAKREMDRLGRVQGQGGGPGRMALEAKMGRNNARSLAEGQRETELGLMDRVNQGRQWGASNLAGAESGLQQLKTGNQMNSMMAALNMERGLGNDIADRKMLGAQSLSQYEKPIQDMLLDEGRWGTGQMRGILDERAAEDQANVAGRNASAQAGWASGQQSDRDRYDEIMRLNQMGLGNEWDIVNFQGNNRGAGTAGMESLFNTNAGLGYDYGNLINQGRGLDQSGTSQYAQDRMANNPHWTQQFGAVAGPIAGAAAGIMTGGASTALQGLLPGRNLAGAGNPGAFRPPGSQFAGYSGNRP